MKGSHSKSYPTTSLGLIQHKTNEKSQFLFLIMFSVKGFPHDLKQGKLTSKEVLVGGQFGNSIVWLRHDCLSKVVIAL